MHKEEEKCIADFCDNAIMKETTIMAYTISTKVI
jgi:hypothetical protein